MDNNPFLPAGERKKKTKLFLWGAWGTGKTTLALQFPKPVMLDMDGGADLYGDRCKFDVLRSATFREIGEAIWYLIDHQDDLKYETIILDPISVYWELLQHYWQDIFLRRNPLSKANKGEYFEFSPTEWSMINAAFKRLFDALVALDMNIVVIAREKTKYKKSAFMVADGVTYDCSPMAPYLFDSVIHLEKTPGGEYIGTAVKDRSGSLPQVDKKFAPFTVNGNFYKTYFSSNSNKTTTAQAVKEKKE